MLIPFCFESSCSSFLSGCGTAARRRKKGVVAARFIDAGAGFNFGDLVCFLFIGPGEHSDE